MIASDDDDAIMREAVATDLDLIGLARDGDRAAFKILYSRHAPSVYSYAVSVLHVNEDAEEMLQDTFVKAWQKLKSVDLVGESALPWLLVLCRNVSLNRRKSIVKNAKVTSDEPVGADDVDTSPGPGDHMVMQATMSDLDAAVARLPETDRAVFELCVIGQMPYKDAAEKLGLPAGSIRNRLFRVRNRLRKEIDERGGL